MTIPILSLETPEDPLVEGWSRHLALTVKNPGPDVLLLEEARADGPLDGVFAWSKAPFGVVLYDGAKDAYIHFTDATAQGAVPIERGLVPAGSTAEAFLPLKPLVAERRRARISLRYRVIPAAELAARLYLPPETMEGRQTLYKLGRPRASDAASAPIGTAIVNATGCPPRVETLEVELEVVEDKDAPSRSAAAHGRIVDRSRALGGAWIVATERGELVALGPGERRIELGRGVALDVFAFVDALGFGETVSILLSDARAAALVAELPVEGRDRGAQWFEAGALEAVLARLVAAGVRVRVGPHGVTEVGLIAESD